MPRTETWFQTWPGLPLRLLLFPIGAAITFAAFFLPDIPFALALLPLAVGIWSGAGPVRFTTMTSFMIWPIFLSAWGLHGLDIGPPELIWSLAAALVILIGLFAAQTGIVPTALLVTLIPVFPASPLLPLAALLPGLGMFGLLSAIAGLALIEATGRPRRRQALLLLSTACLGIWTMGHALIRGHIAGTEDDTWREQAEPRAFGDRARWIALRDSLPEQGTVILGENVFTADDDEARAFWCHAVEGRTLTLFLGVAEPYGHILRSAVWRLDAESCEDAGRSSHGLAVHRATFGIPRLTGTWGPMGRHRIAPGGGVQTTERTGPDVDWLICLEAFLPQAWAGLLPDRIRTGPAPRPIMVLSNDMAFRPLPALSPMPAFGRPPVHELRRKAARAMAGLAGRTVHFAETGRTILLHTPEPE